MGYDNHTILESYEEEIKKNGYSSDKGQKNVLGFLYQLSIEWEKFTEKKNKLLIRNPAVPKGLYIYGGVGRGKTFLMDIFYESVTVKKKLRIHFHEFMQNIQEELSILKGYKEPIFRISKKLAGRYHLICFDEFHVQDIAHAMIFESLFKFLNELNVSFVITSNFSPDDLYKDGLQRESFIPAIMFLKSILEIIHIPDGPDHRRARYIEPGCLRFQNRNMLQQKYHFPHDEKCQQVLQTQFNTLTNGPVQSADYICIANRKINVVAMAEDVCWLKFDALCSSFRSKEEYLDLSDVFHTFIVERVPILTRENLSAATRFTWFVDIIYDRKRKLILTASVSIEKLFCEKMLTIDFERTKSRLHEITSVGI